MAIADGGELVVLAPALKEFGEDKEIDRLIRKYGYFGTPETLKAVEDNEELRNNLGAAAHLIHGSSEGRFSITYCPGKGAETSHGKRLKMWLSVGDIDETMQKYNFQHLKKDLTSCRTGKRYIIFQAPPWIWAHRDRFEY